MTRNRDVRVTIDTRLQLAVAAILTRAARASGSGKGAVIVLDADTGEILASVSYPRGQTGSDQGQTGVRPVDPVNPVRPSTARPLWIARDTACTRRARRSR